MFASANIASDHRQHLPKVATAEKVEVVEKVVEVIERFALAPSGREWMSFLIRSIELRGLASEQRGHREIGFTMPVGNRRVNQPASTLCVDEVISRPQVSVQQRRGFFRP